MSNPSRQTRFLIASFVILFTSLVFLGPPIWNQWAAFLAADRPVLTNADYGNYYIAAVETLQGRGAKLFEPTHYQDLIATYFPGSQTYRSWSYPPHYLFMIAPFGLFSPEISLIVFLIASFGMYVFAARTAAPNLDLKLILLGTSGFVLTNIWGTQNGMLTSSFLLGAVALRNRAPFIAGLLISCYTVKPQLGLLIPFILLFERRWTIIAGAIAGTLILIAASVLVFGIDAWMNYFGATSAEQMKVLTEWEGIFEYMMPTAYSGARLFGLSLVASVGVQAIFSIAAILLVLKVAADKTIPTSLRLALYALCAVMFTPYAFNYDLGVTTLLSLAAIHHLENSNTKVQTSLAVLAGILPVCFVLVFTFPVPLLPALMATLIGVLAWPVVSKSTFKQIPDSR
jgi:arabinofuranan 3-O-arabinosyltransferase